MIRIALRPIITIGDARCALFTQLEFKYFRARSNA